jgi:hypothetical protein
MGVTKTYLVTNTLETRFPAEFYNSQNKKWIVMQHCRVTYNNINDEGYLVSDIMVHADFIERNHDLDYFACFSNTQLTKYKKWEVVTPRQSFRIWFTDMEGNPILVKTKAEEEVQKRKQDMLKKYEADMNVTAEVSQEEVATEEEEAAPVAYISSLVLELMLIY